jgi:hypothetical protein
MAPRVAETTLQMKGSVCATEAAILDPKASVKRSSPFQMKR